MNKKESEKQIISINKLLLNDTMLLDYINNSKYDIKFDMEE